MKNILVLLAVFFLQKSIVNAQSAEEIINLYLDTVSNGNLQNLYDVKSIYIETKGFYSQADNEGKLTLTPPKIDYGKQYKIWPGKEKIELYSDSARSKLTSSFFRLNGKMTILFPNMTPVEGPPRGGYELPAVEIHKLLKKHKRISNNGIREIDSIPYHDIEVHTEENGKIIIYHLYFATDNFLLTYQNGSIDGNTLSRISNYKRFGEILVPTEVVAMRGTSIFFSSQITTLIINGDIPPEVFKIPKQ